MINQVFKVQIQEIKGNERNPYAWAVYLLSVGIRVTVLFSGLGILRVNALIRYMTWFLFYVSAEIRKYCFHGEQVIEGKSGRVA